MTELYIIGTGGAAKEIIQLIEQINAVNPTYEIKGFIDLARSSESITFFGRTYDFYEEASFIETRKNAAVVVAHGLAAFRAKIFAKFSDFEFPNLIHPLVDIHDSVTMGKGNIIKMGCLLTTDITIGDNNYINRGTQIGHDVNMGNSNVFNPGCIISGGVELGIQNNIGANATILQYIKIGNDNTLGAGAVLTTNATDHELLIGLPAKNKS